jgi:hypothetical protein
MTKTDRKALEKVLEYLREGEHGLAEMKLVEFMRSHSTN